MGGKAQSPDFGYSCCSFLCGLNAVQMGAGVWEAGSQNSDKTLNSEGGWWWGGRTELALCLNNQ